MAPQSALPNIADEPILPPPPGVTPNFVNPPSRAHDMYATVGICLPLIFIFAVIRYYAKFKILKRRTWDDLTCALGLFAGVSYICITVAAVGGGAYGQHSWDVKIGQFTKSQLLLSLLAEAASGPCIWCIKLSLFVLYLEVFGLIKWLRYCAFFGMIVTGAFYFAVMIVFIVMCGPKNGNSQFSYLAALASQRCTNTHPATLAMGVMDIVSDFYLVILPLPALWSLQMPLRRKLGVAAMLSTGLMQVLSRISVPIYRVADFPTRACIASVIGLVYRIDVIRTHDNTWEVIPSWLTTIVQMTAGLLVCCMPSSAVLFKRIKGPLRSFASLSNHPHLLKALSPRSWTSKTTSNVTKSEKVGHEGGERLPSIEQRGTMTGMRTFIDERGRVGRVDAQVIGSFDQGEDEDVELLKVTGRGRGFREAGVA